MWEVSILLSIGIYDMIPENIIGHEILISADFVAVVTYTIASLKPDLFKNNNGHNRAGEHE